MKNAVLIVGTLLLAATAADAAPRFGSSSMAAEAEARSSDRKAGERGLAAFLQRFTLLKVTAAPQPTDGGTATDDSTVKECDEAKPATQTKAKETTEIAKQSSGPEPLYLAF